jgi:TM2 domain-containing membrane protein YozV
LNQKLKKEEIIMVWTAAWTDFVICLLFGWLGAHKFREKKIGMGILYLLTFGLFSIGWFVDTIRYLIAAIKGERISRNRPERLEFNETLSDVPSNHVTSNKDICHYSDDAKTEKESLHMGFLHTFKRKSNKKWIIAGVGALCVIGLLAGNGDDNKNDTEIELASVIETESYEIAESTEVFSTDEETETETESIEESIIEPTTVETEISNESAAKVQTETSSESTVKTQTSSVAQPDTAPAATEQTSSDTVINPSGESNFNTYNNTEQQNTTSQYVLNTSSHKIHLPNCSSVSKIAPENYSTSDLSIEDLESQGYSRCGNCLK